MRANEYAPPWGTKPAWQEANCSIGDLLQRHSGKLSSTAALAAAIRVRLESVFDLLDVLCMEARFINATA